MLTKHNMTNEVLGRLLYASENDLAKKYGPKFGDIQRKTDRVISNTRAIEEFVKELRSRFVVVQELYDQHQAVEAGINIETDSNRENLCVLTSQKYRRGSYPLLCLQGAVKFVHRNEEISVRVGLAFPEPVAVFVCFPLRDEIDPPFYGKFELILRFIKNSGEVCFTQRITDVDADNGSCEYPSTATAMEHINCEEPTYSDAETFITSDDEKQLLESCLVVADDKDDYCLSTLRMEVEFIPLVEGKDEEQFIVAADNPVNEITNNLQPANQSMPSENHDILKPTNDSVPSDIKVTPKLLRPIQTPEEDDELPTPVKAQVENCMEGNQKLICKLSLDSQAALKSWLLSSNIDSWKGDIPVNLDLLHFAHRCQMSDLIAKVLTNLESVNDKDFTLEFAMDVFAAAEMYRAEMPELLRRIAHFILDKNH